MLSLGNPLEIVKTGRNLTLLMLGTAQHKGELGLRVKGDLITPFLTVYPTCT